MIALENHSLYLCTPLRDDLDTFVADCIAGGVDIVQLREKHAPPESYRKEAVQLRRLCTDLGVPFIMNDHPEFAVDIEADGVHVGQDDVSVAHCRDLLGENAIIGLSTHQSSELTLGIKEPVTYLSAGPVKETPTKPGRAGTGVAYVEDAVLRSPVPVFVTGGVTASAIAKLGRTGVRRFVVVRALTESPRPLEAAKELRFAIDALEAP